MPSLIKDSTITLITRGLTFAILMISNIIIARMLGPSLKGSYNIVMLVMSMTTLFVLFGLGSANVYFGARNPDKLSALAGNSILAAFGLGLLGVVIVELLVAQPIVENYLTKNGVEINWIRWLILFIPLVLLASYLKEIVRAAGYIFHYNLIFLWGGGFSFVAIVVLVWVFALGIEGGLIAWGVTQVATSLLTLGLALRAVGKRLRINWSDLSQSFLFGVRLYPGNIAQYLNYRLDVFLIALFLTPSEIGFYVLATTLAEKLWELPQAIRTVLLHRVAGTADFGEANLRTARISRVIFSLMGVICFTVALLGYPSVYVLYGTVYLPTVPALILLMPGVWFLSLGKLLAVHLVGIGHPEVGPLSSITSLIVTFILDLVLIPKFGIIGAAIASSFSYASATVVILIVFNRVTQLSLANITLINRDDVLILHRVFKRAFLRHFPHLFAHGKSW